jgi:hypothetical protein
VVKHLATDDDVQAAEDEAAKLQAAILNVLTETPLNAAKLAVKVHKRKETVLKALADMGRTKVKKDKQGVWSAVKKWSAKAAIEATPIN